MVDYLAHHGVKGMHWGIRRYQKADGSLTRAGKKRQANRDKVLKQHESKIKRANSEIEYNKKALSDIQKKNIRSKYVEDIYDGDSDFAERNSHLYFDKKTGEVKSYKELSNRNKREVVNAAKKSYQIDLDNNIGSRDHAQKVVNNLKKAELNKKSYAEVSKMSSDITIGSAAVGAVLSVAIPVAVARSSGKSGVGAAMTSIVFGAPLVGGLAGGLAGSTVSDKVLKLDKYLK